MSEPVADAARAAADAAERLKNRLAALAAVGEAITRADDLEALFQSVYRETSKVLDTTGFILALYHESSQTVEVVKQVEGGAELPGGSFPLGGGFTSQVIRTGEPRLIRNWSIEGPRVSVRYATGEHRLPESGLTVPLMWNRRVTGVLSLQSYEPATYDEDDLATLQTIAGLTAVAVENLRRSRGLDEQLRTRVAELQAILASMADALLILDADGRIAQLNRAARELLSVADSSVVLGQPLDREHWGEWPLGPQAVAHALDPVVQAVRDGETLRDVEVEAQIGGRRVLSLSCAPIRGLDGALRGGVIVFRDVTGRREVERLKDDVLSIASHDLKTPIAAMRLRAQLLQQRLSTGRSTAEDMAAGLAGIVAQADRAAGMLDLLLDYSRVEAGRLELERVPTDLIALIRAEIDRVQTTSDLHHLDLQAPTAVEGEWDERRLEQVLQNLLANAVKYSPKGGRVEVSVVADGRNVTVRIRDEGVGLAPDEAARVFERFYRARGARRLEGSGLGLHICQAIVSAHGGRIWAESEGPEHGSTFAFTLPLTTAEEEP